ncbi:MAG: VOC family protein [Actinomycetota bacterium]
MPEFHLDHVAVAVHSIKAALPLFRDVLGGEYVMGGDVAGIWRWFQLRYPDGRKIELLEPLGEGFLADFLAKRGEGLHHITFKTDDIEAAIEKAQSHGYELVDIRLDSDRWKEAFLRPKSAHGTLIQIAQSAMSDEDVLRTWTPPSVDELLG